jgi:hypothetical protein
MQAPSVRPYPVCININEGQGMTDGSAWRRARPLRERAMADHDAHERLDGRDGLTQPGARPRRPGGRPGAYENEEDARQAEIAKEAVDHGESTIATTTSVKTI